MAQVRPLINIFDSFAAYISKEGGGAVAERAFNNGEGGKVMHFDFIVLNITLYLSPKLSQIDNIRLIVRAEEANKIISSA
jgi:hypothetical protein